MATLGTRDTMTLKSIDRYLESNNRIVLGGQIPRLKALVQNYEIEEVLYKYYMLLAALRPDELVKEYESNVADEYWQTYWVAIAYMKLNKVAEAEDAIVKLRLYPSYPEYNALLLSAVGTLAELGVEETSSYVAAVNPEQCSPLLAPFLHALYFEVVPERAKSVGARRENCLFYIENIVSLESPEEKEAKRKAEEEAKRKAAEEDARRKAAEEAKRKAEEEARRKAAADAKRKAEEAKRKAEEEAAAKRKKRNMWLAIVAIFVVALFVIPGLFGDDKDAAIEEGSATMIRTIEEESTIEEENAAMKRAIEEQNDALSEWEKIVSGTED
jgi:hypothetical protein